MCFILLTIKVAAHADPISVAVIGSGPAGLSAALVTAKEKKHTVVFQGERAGGPLNAHTCLGNWPGAAKGKGKDVMQRLFDQTQKAGVFFSSEAVNKVDFSRWPYELTLSSGKKEKALTVIIATGSIARKLAVPGEDTKGVVSSVYKTDGPKFLGKQIAVVGSGIDAVKKTLILSKWADQVYLIVRSKQLKNIRHQKKIEMKKRENIHILYESEVRHIFGGEEGMTAIEIQTPSGETNLIIDQLVLAVGIVPNSELFRDQIACDAQGYILVEGRSQKTSHEAVFAAGSVTDPDYRQAAISAGDGMKAGYDALRFLSSITPH